MQSRGVSVVVNEASADYATSSSSHTSSVVMATTSLLAALALQWPA